MAKTVVWSKTATEQLREILAYWTERNGSNAYSIKLRNGIRSLTNHIAKYPDSGILCQNSEYRFRIIRDYEVYYRQTKSTIRIVLIWDGRRNPESLPVDFWAYPPE